MAELKVAIEATFSIYGKLHPCNFFFFWGGGEGSITLKYIIMLILSKVLSVKT